jgi:hypothetical protein
MSFNMIFCGKCGTRIINGTRCPDEKCSPSFPQEPYPTIKKEPWHNYTPHVPPEKKEAVDHPSHYGGKDNPYEAIKVIEAWKLGFNLGNTVKYISRAGKKDALVQDLEKQNGILKEKLQTLKKLLMENGSEASYSC